MVIALIVTITFAVILLGVLVAGLLRSHADILRALHSLGAGIGDPMAEDDAPTVPIQLGRQLTPERGTDAVDVAGQTLGGDAVAVAASAAPLTLLAFLSSGCATCGGFWSALRDGDALGLPPHVRLVVVTKGPELEELPMLERLAPVGIELVMSTDAWIDYEVPGSPFFVLVDESRRRIGEGLAGSLEAVTDLVRRAVSDRRPTPVHQNGPERELDNDRALRAAGIEPGDPSLYPRPVRPS